jgi:hypothetical protein
VCSVLLLLTLASGMFAHHAIASTPRSGATVVYLPVFTGNGAGLRDPTPTVAPTPTAVPPSICRRSAPRSWSTSMTRAAAGCPPVAAYELLTDAAQAWSDQMAVIDVFAHSPMNWYQERGYRTPHLGSREVVATGHPTADEVVHAWLNSPPHRTILLSCPYAEYTYEAGVGMQSYRWTVAIGMIYQGERTPTPSATMTATPTPTVTMTETSTAAPSATMTPTPTSESFGRPSRGGSPVC